MPSAPIASAAPLAPSAPPARSLRSRALQWLAQREHSRTELRRKLVALARTNGPDADPAARSAEIESLLDRLEAEGYLCDARFVESRVHARLDRFGNTRIRLELARHGAALSQEAEQRLRESEYERAHAVWSRKYRTSAPDAAGRARQSRFLAGRGFGADVIARVLRAAARGAAGDRARPEDIDTGD